MKYRTKLNLAFISVSIASTALAVTIGTIKTYKYLFSGLQREAITIAVMTAADLNGDALKNIKTVQDQNSPEYVHIRKQLRDIRDMNRRDGTYISYLYTIYIDPNHPEEFLFGVDAEENGKNFSPAGSEDPGAREDHLAQNLDKPYSYKKLNPDPWGVWLTGYAPVYDSRGEYVATVGADISIEYVQGYLKRSVGFGILFFVISIAFAWILSTLLAKRVVRALDTLTKATVEIGKGNLSIRVHVETNDEFEGLAASINHMNEGLEEKERLKLGFARYVSKNVLEKILKSKGSAKLEGERRKITVLFSDIRNFTHYAESMEPEKVFAFLNGYLEVMIDIIFKYNGMLDKMVGDGIMAEFGTPLDDPKQEKNAVLAALEMERAVLSMREKWKKEGLPEINVGFGIHTGEAIVGTIGSEKRMEYTAIGDTVNTAFRLQDATKGSGHSIIISDSTYQAIANDFRFTNLGPLLLKGKETPIVAYAVKNPSLY